MTAPLYQIPVEDCSHQKEFLVFKACWPELVPDKPYLHECSRCGTSMVLAERMCECGCGQPTAEGARFIRYHISTGPRSANWKGGKRVLPNGYVTVWAPLKFRRHPNQPRIYEHVLKACQAIGRVLPIPAQVHHINNDRGDNRNTNLVVCENADYHGLLHQRAAALAACGNANFRQCQHCGEWADPASPGMFAVRRKAEHRQCRNAYARSRAPRRRIGSPLHAANDARGAA